MQLVKYFVCIFVSICLRHVQAKPQGEGIFDRHAPYGDDDGVAGIEDDFDDNMVEFTTPPHMDHPPVARPRTDSSNDFSRFNNNNNNNFNNNFNNNRTGPTYFKNLGQLSSNFYHNVPGVERVFQPMTHCNSTIMTIMNCKVRVFFVDYMPSFYEGLAMFRTGALERLCSCPPPFLTPDCPNILLSMIRLVQKHCLFY